MSIEENRNCGCNDNYDNNMNDTTNSCGCKTNNTIDCDARDEMLEQIKCRNFAIVELGLYLNTHPDDDKALCLHRRYSKELKELKDKYQKVYGPLTIYFPCNKWRWLEEPCPSFELGVTLKMLKNKELDKLFFYSLRQH